MTVNTDGASEMEFFVLVARHGSLAAAARALDLTPPAATKRLAQMEARLGVRLVNRTTRRLSLTSEGETYLAHAARILAAIREMEDAVACNRTAPRGLLRVNEPRVRPHDHRAHRLGFRQASSAGRGAAGRDGPPRRPGGKRLRPRHPLRRAAG